MDRRRFVEIVAGTAAGGAMARNASVGLLDADNLEQLAQLVQAPSLEQLFRNPPSDAGLWVVWHWMNANVTKEGVTKDLEEMAAAGIKNPCMFSVGARTETGTIVSPPADPLTDHWWDLVRHAIAECKRLNMTMAMQVCDGWASAGGPAITPELSMQKVVFSERTVQGGSAFSGVIARPAIGGGEGAANAVGATLTRGQEMMRDAREYYRDIAVMAFPVPNGWDETNETRQARLTSSFAVRDLAKLGQLANTESMVDTDQAGYFQFAFDQPFTLRSISVRSGATIPPPGAAVVAPAGGRGAGGGGGGGGGGGFGGGAALNIPSHSMTVQASDDGTNFRKVGQLDAMMGGWQTRIANLTHAVPEVTARFFRLVYTPGPVLPYDEQRANSTRPDDNNRLKVASIALSSTAVVHHLPGKNQETWGRSRAMTVADAPAKASVPASSIVDLTSRMSADGSLDWQVPAGKWRVVRIGHTSTGKTNSPAGAGQGLEADKLNPAATLAQFHGWFGEALKRAGPEGKAALRVLNIDSWECGAQNWSPVLRDEFKKRRGYDMMSYLPAMIGYPIENGDVTERYLRDVRRTMTECTVDNFWKLITKLAHDNDCIVSSETTGPVYPGDGMAHYAHVDVPAGEFWAGAMQNWKPLDIKESVSMSRLYGKKATMTESFTGGGRWIEHPGNLKALGDFNFAQGINRFMLHLWGEQAFPDRWPGVAGSAGTQFNYHQTWWRPGHKWFEYLKRSQAVLQTGTNVSDVLYFTGEELPRRAMIEPENGSTFVIDPVLPPGYAFDSINRDALLGIASVANGRIVFPSGASYRVLVLQSGEDFLSIEVARKLKALVTAGANIVGPKPAKTSSLQGGAAADAELRAIADSLWGKIDGKTVTENTVGAGRVFFGKPMVGVLSALDVAPDVAVTGLVDATTGAAFTAKRTSRYNPTEIGQLRFGGGIQWTHKNGPGYDFYFLTNQEPTAVSAQVTFRTAGRVPEFWNAETGAMADAPRWRTEGDKTVIPMEMDYAQSLFVVFRRPVATTDQIVAVTPAENAAQRKGFKLERGATGTAAWLSQSGDWTLRTRSGKSVPVSAKNVPEPTAVTGPWAVTFVQRGKAPKQVQLANLISWPTHDDPYVKFFSGTATYAKDITVPALLKGSDRRVMLDLGNVGDIAEVRLNGKAVGVLLKAPFMIDVTSALVAGTNKLEVEITNTWRNRLTGDVGKTGDDRSSWIHNYADRALTPETMTRSGLFGPVRLVTEVRVDVPGTKNG